MKLNKLFTALLLIIVHTQCSVLKHPPQYAAITEEGFLNCFEENLTANNSLAWSEASAILFDGHKLFLANDKEMPDSRSAVFYWNFRRGNAIPKNLPNYMVNPVFKKQIKYEDFALTPDGKYKFEQYPRINSSPMKL